MENMDMLLAAEDLVKNKQTRAPICICVDGSMSMALDGKMKAVNEKLNEMIKDIKDDERAEKTIDLLLFSFHNLANEAVCDFGSAANVTDDSINIKPFGMALMENAIEYALERLDDRRRLYKRNSIESYHPLLIIISDGLPIDDEEASKAAERVRGMEKKHLLNVVAVQVGDDPESMLQEFSERPVQTLEDTNISDLFMWLSRSNQKMTGDVFEDQDEEFNAEDEYDE